MGKSEVLRLPFFRHCSWEHEFSKMNDNIVFLIDDPTSSRSSSNTSSKDPLFREIKLLVVRSLQRSSETQNFQDQQERPDMSQYNDANILYCGMKILVL